MATIGAGAKGVLKKFTGIDSDCIDAAIDETTEISKGFLAEYKSQKKLLKTLKEIWKNMLLTMLLINQLYFY